MRVFKNKFHEWSFKTHYVKDNTEAKKAATILLGSSRLLGCDIETAKKPEYKDHPKAGLDPHLSLIRLIQIFDGVDTIWVFDMFHVNIETLRELLEKGHFCAHHAKFELTHFTFNKVPGMNVGCSMLMSQMVDGAEHSPFEPDDDEDEDDEDKTGLSQYRRKGHSLDACVQRLFGVKVEKKLQVSDWGKAVLDGAQITYASLDALLTYKVAKELAPKISEYKMGKAYKLLKDAQHVVAEMEIEGYSVDWKYHKKLMDEWELLKDEALEKCKPYFTVNGELINLRSSKQMGEWLVGYLKDDPTGLLNWPKTSKGSYAFGKNVISSFTKYPAVKVLLEYKKYAKLIDTYGESLVEKRNPLTGNLHSSYSLGQTRTGRLTSYEPNGQNFPRLQSFRDMFCTKKGFEYVVSDFSQIELRLQAELSKDPVMLDCYKRGEDIYCRMASEIYGRLITKEDKAERFVGKTVMLALGYGMGSTKFALYAANAGVVKPQVFWDKAHKTYHKLFNVYSRWCDKIRDRARQLGYIETMYGKRRKLTVDELFTRAPNTVIQGSAAELMLRAMIICKNTLENQGVVVASVHDELILRCNEQNSCKVKSCLASSMNNAFKEMFPKAVSFNVADASSARRWGEAKAEL